jgi:hypothetical protein
MVGSGRFGGWDPVPQIAPSGGFETAPSDAERARVLASFGPVAGVAPSTAKPARDAGPAYRVTLEGDESTVATAVAVLRAVAGVTVVRAERRTEVLGVTRWEEWSP